MNTGFGVLCDFFVWLMLGRLIEAWLDLCLPKFKVRWCASFAEMLLKFKLLCIVEATFLPLLPMLPLES